MTLYLSFKCDDVTITWRQREQNVNMYLLLLLIKQMGTWVQVVVINSKPEVKVCYVSSTSKRRRWLITARLWRNRSSSSWVIDDSTATSVRAVPYLAELYCDKFTIPLQQRGHVPRKLNKTLCKRRKLCNLVSHEWICNNFLKFTKSICDIFTRKQNWRQNVLIRDV